MVAPRIKPHNDGIDGLSHGPTDWLEVTQDTDLDPRPRGIVVTVSGLVQLLSDNGNDEDIPMNSGVFYGCRPKQVKSANTTATGIIALY